VAVSSRAPGNKVTDNPVTASQPLNLAMVSLVTGNQITRSRDSLGRQANKGMDNKVSRVTASKGNMGRQDNTDSKVNKVTVNLDSKDMASPAKVSLVKFSPRRNDDSLESALE